MRLGKYSTLILLAILGAFMIDHCFPRLARCAEPTNAAVAREIVQEGNRAIIEAFLKYELEEVNRNVTDKLLDRHPSLVFS